MVHSLLHSARHLCSYCESADEEIHQFPASEHLTKVVQGFEKTWGFPQCARAIDGLHIPIAAPTDNHTDYYNRKGWYSVVIQGVVDY